MNAQKYPLKYSQNFLNSKNTIKKLLSIANISKSDIIYEIGAGKGAITKELAYLCREVHAIEYDIELHEYLRNNVNHKNIRHICIDVLDYKFPDSGDFKVVSNIPYTITSAILDKLLFSRNPPVDSYVIIQKEAALRYSGSPYKNDTLKSLMLKPFFLFEILYELKKSK